MKTKRAAKFPASEGWIKMTFEMSKPTPLGEAAIKKLSTFGAPVDGVEFGKVEQHGKKIVVISRPKPKAVNGKAVAA